MGLVTLTLTGLNGLVEKSKIYEDAIMIHFPFCVFSYLLQPSLFFAIVLEALITGVDCLHDDLDDFDPFGRPHDHEKRSVPPSSQKKS